MEFLAHLVVSSGLLLLVAQVIPGIALKGAFSALLAALVLGLVNALLRPVAVLLTLPLTILTLGLFLLIVNAAMLKLTSALVPGFKISGFLPALWASVLLTALNLLVGIALQTGT